MKLSQWARKNNVHYKTAYRLFHEGKLPVKATQWPTGTIMVSDDVNTQLPVVTGPLKIAIYARVSSSDQATDLDRQVARLCTFAATKSYQVNTVVCEIASGMNANRPKLLKLLADSSHQAILVEHTDRLTRFGAPLIEATLKAQGRKLLVMDTNETSQVGDDLVIDMIDIMTSFCARLYGRRSAKNRAERALRAAETASATDALDDAADDAADDTE